MDERKYSFYTCVLISITFLIRILIASFYGLSGDEAHYYQYAVHPSLSYFDHPPFVGYAILFFLKIFGNTSCAVRMPALISSTLCMLLLFKAGKNFHSSAAGFWAVVIFCLIPLFSVLGGIMTVPDTILSIFWLGSMLLLWEINRTGKSSLWYVLGIMVGLGLLTKYTGVLMYAAILLFLIINRNMRIYFKSKQMYLGIVISILIFSPVFVWNYNNYWVSFVFQFKHGLGEKNFFEPDIFFKNIAAQMSVISPILWLLLLTAFINITKKIMSSDSKNRLFFSFVLPVFLVFGYASFFNEILPHWPSQAYLTLILPASFLVLEAFRRHGIRKFFIISSLIVGGIFTLIIPVQVVFHWLPLSPDLDPTCDLYGWDKAAQVAEYLRSSHGKNTFLFTNKFYLAGQMAFHLPENTAKNHLYCLSSRIDQYDFWQRDRNLQKELDGKTGIFFTDQYFRASPEKMYRFETIEKILTLEIFYMKKKVQSFYFYECYNFKAGDTNPQIFNSLSFSERSFFRDLISLDNQIFLFLNKIASNNTLLARILFGFGYLGSTEINVLCVILVVYFARKEKFLGYTGIFIAALILGALFVHMLKEFIHSSRPLAYFKDSVVYWVGPALKSGSFPSGHAQTAFTAACFLSWIFPGLRVLFFSLSVIVGFSRIFCGVHFPRDVLCGAIIGIVCFYAVLWIFTRFFKMFREQIARNLTFEKK